MSDLSKDIADENIEEPIFDNKEEDVLISKSVKKEDQEENTNKELGVEDAQAQEKVKKSKDITSKKHPDIEINGTSSNPWGWIVSGIIALGLIGAVVYGINNMEDKEASNAPETSQTQTQTMEAEPPHEENEGDEVEE